MWQRIQTLYLFLATVFTGLLFFCAKATGPDGTIAFTSYLPYVLLAGIVSALNLLALTTWKFRIFQMRTAILSALITLALQVWIAVDFLTADKSVVFHVAAVFPAVSVILEVMAARSIFADELIVRNASRLRSAKRK